MTTVTVDAEVLERLVRAYHEEDSPPFAEAKIRCRCGYRLRGGGLAGKRGVLASHAEHEVREALAGRPTA